MNDSNDEDDNCERDSVTLTLTTTIVTAQKNFKTPH